MDVCFLCLRVRFLLLPPPRARCVPNVRLKLVCGVGGGAGSNTGTSAGVEAGAAGVDAGAACGGLYDKPTEGGFLGPVGITAG